MKTFCFAAGAMFFGIAAFGPHNWPVYIICGVAWIAVGFTYDE